MTDNKDMFFNSAAPDETDDSNGEHQSKIQSPHDGFFRGFFDEKETAESFIREYLPAHITSQLNLDSLKISKDTFIDKKMSRYYSDILYEVMFRDKPLLLYFLFEHKSAEEWFICLQLLKYMTKIWEHYLKQHQNVKYLPVIIPLVIYHGKKKWSIGKNFSALFEDPTGMENHIPKFSYDLYDISHLSDEDIKGTVLLKILLTTMKYAFNPDLQQKLGDIFKLFDKLADKTKATEYLEVLLRYLMDTRDFQAQEIQESMDRVFADGGDIMPTLAERLREEGMQKGMEQNNRTVVRNLLLKGFSIDEIAEVIDQPAAKVRQMKTTIEREKSSPIHEAERNKTGGSEHRA